MENFNSSSIITPPPPTHCHCSPSLVVYKSSRPGAHTFLMQYATSHEPTNPRILSSFLPKFPYHTFYTLFDCWCIKRNKERNKSGIVSRKGNCRNWRLEIYWRKNVPERSSKIKGIGKPSTRTSFDLSTFKRHSTLSSFSERKKQQKRKCG